MLNVRDSEAKNTTKTLSALCNEQDAEHTPGESLADVQELIELLTLRGARLREWIYWAVSAVRIREQGPPFICLFFCRASSTTMESMIAS